MNLPNKLTIFRIILVIVMVVLSCFNIPGEFLGVPILYWLLDAIFIIASITDKMDGYLARSRNQITTFGKFADPLADKILVLTAMLLLVQDGRLPAVIPIIVLIREFVVSGYRLIAVEKGGKVIAANVWGKLKTVTQMLAIILAFVDIHAFGAVFGGGLTGFSFWLNLVSTILMTVSSIATIFSGWSYVKEGKELFQE